MTEIQVAGEVFFTRPQLARALGVSVRTIERLSQRGALVGVRAGGARQIYYDAAKVQAFLRGETRAKASKARSNKR